MVIRPARQRKFEFMNVQTDPSLSKGVIDPLPARPDQPIRSTFYHEASSATSARSWRAARSAVPGFNGIRFPAPHPRQRRHDPRGLPGDQRGAGQGDAITPAAQWLLDNHYLIDETVFQVKRDLPRRFYRELPVESFGDGHRCRAPWRSPGPMSRIPTARCRQRCSRRSSKATSRSSR